MSESNSSNHRCHVCGKSANSCCSICETTWFCGRDCQRTDWKQHKKTCRKPELEYKLTILSRYSATSRPEWLASAKDRAALYTDHSVLPPRMACKLFYYALCLIVELRFACLNWSSLGVPVGCTPEAEELPPMGRHFFRTNPKWRMKMTACMERIALRLHKGIMLVPNCVGEVVCMRWLIAEVRQESVRYPPPSDTDGSLVHLECFQNINQLPETRYDDIDSLQSHLLNLDHQESLILATMLLEMGKESYEERQKLSLDDSRDFMLSFARAEAERFLHGKSSDVHYCTQHFLKSKTSKLWNIHPARWFVVFDDKLFENHEVENPPEPAPTTNWEGLKERNLSLVLLHHHALDRSRA